MTRTITNYSLSVLIGALSFLVGIIFIALAGIPSRIHFMTSTNVRP